MSLLPKVSVVTPSYNQARYLEETMLSVLNQDYPRAEYVVMDGGSIDGSVEIIRRHEARLAYWSSAPDEGQSDAINRGWQRCTGEILAWLNSDDTYEAGAIEAAVGAFAKHPDVYLVYGHLNHIDDRGRVFRRFIAPEYDLRTFIGGPVTCYMRQPTVFVRREALERAGFLDVNLRYAMDHDLYIRICRHFAAWRIPQVLASFRFHAGSKTVSDEEASGRNTFWPEERMLMERVASDPGFPADVRALSLKRIGYQWYGYREFGKARRMWVRAVLAHKPLMADKELWYLFAKSLVGVRSLEMAKRARSNARFHLS